MLLEYFVPFKPFKGGSMLHLEACCGTLSKNFPYQVLGIAR